MSNNQPASPFNELNNAAITAMHARRFDEALRLIERAQEFEPNSVPSLFNYAICLSELKRHQDVIDVIDRIIKLAPQDHWAWNLRAVSMRALGLPDEAIDSFNKAINFAGGDFPQGSYNRGRALAELGHLPEALADYDAALKSWPHPVAYNNRANVLQMLDRPEEALASADEAIKLAPDMADAHSNRAIALQSLHRFGPALDSFNRALDLAPDHTMAAQNKGTMLMLQGEYGLGLPLYEARLREYPGARWNGQDIQGRSILLHAEQGLGDTIMAYRYVPLVASLGALVVLSVQPALVDLLRGDYQIAPDGASTADYDYHCPMMSLPLAFGSSPETLPRSCPYLPAQQPWLDREPGSKLRVGIVWAGNPKFPHDSARSIGLAAMMPLFENNAVSFYSLQKDKRPGDELPHDVTDLGVHIDSFTTTARMIASMDLIIGVDTSVIHLAGALAKPTWVLLPNVPDWRWGHEGPHTPWYPTARLFRKSRQGDWAGVIEQVKDELGRYR